MDVGFRRGQSATGVKVEHTFTEAGRWPVELTVSDPHGASTRTTLVVSPGNAAPQVSFAAPLEGSFFEWGKPIHYRFTATDEEDGPLPAEQVLVQAERRERAHLDDEAAVFPGLTLMRAGTCFACHRAAEKSAGPAYLEVARRYAAEPAARERLAKKVVSGGGGGLGRDPDASASSAHHRTNPANAGLDSFSRLRETQIRRGRWMENSPCPPRPHRSALSPMACSSSPPPRTITARPKPRRCRANRPSPSAPAASTPPLSTAPTGVTTQHNLEGGDGLVARMEQGSWLPPPPRGPPPPPPPPPRRAPPSTPPRSGWGRGGGRGGAGGVCGGGIEGGWGLGEAGEAGDVDAVASVGAAFDDAVQEDDLVFPFADGDVEVFHAAVKRSARSVSSW